MHKRISKQLITNNLNNFPSKNWNHYVKNAINFGNNHRSSKF